MQRGAGIRFVKMDGAFVGVGLSPPRVSSGNSESTADPAPTAAVRCEGSLLGGAAGAVWSRRPPSVLRALLQSVDSRQHRAPLPVTAFRTKGADLSRADCPYLMFTVTVDLIMTIMKVYKNQFGMS